MTIFAPAARRGLFVDWAFFDGSEISSEFVGGQCASWRLPPKAAVSTYGRHSFVEGIRNGGLDVLKTAAVPGKSIMGARSCLPCNGFFLSPSCGAGLLGLFGLFLCECLLIAKVIPPNPGSLAGYGTTYDTGRFSSSVSHGFHILPTFRYQGQEFGRRPPQYGAGEQS